MKNKIEYTQNYYLENIDDDDKNHIHFKKVFGGAILQINNL